MDEQKLQIPVDFIYKKLGEKEIAIMMLQEEIKRLQQEIVRLQVKGKTDGID